MLIIKNGLIFDGTPTGCQHANLVIQGGHVRQVTSEPVNERHATRVIDAQGKWVMPGFLDTHTHYDAEILAGPGLNESVRHGVTTVAIGSCSLSTILSSPEDCADFFCRVEALPREAVLPALKQHKTWETPEGYPLELPVEVAVDGTRHRVAMRGGQGALAVPADADVDIDPDDWILKAE